MSDLTEFLLARIAEDEEWWRTSYEQTDPLCEFALRDFEAKRRIVQRPSGLRRGVAQSLT